MPVRKVRPFTDVDLVGGDALAATEKEWPFVEPHLAEPQLWPVTLTADSVVEPPALDAAGSGVDVLAAASSKASPALGGVRLPLAARACKADLMPTRGQRAYMPAAADATSCHGPEDMCGASPEARWPSSPATTDCGSHSAASSSAADHCDPTRSGRPEEDSPAWWPATPTLDSVLEPPAFDAAGRCSGGAVARRTLDLETALGLDESDSALGSMRLPEAALQSVSNGVPMQGCWVYMHLAAAPVSCHGRQHACYESPGARIPHAADGPEEAARTSVILRSLPHRLTRDLLVQALDRAGFARQYDFVYVPMDFKTGANIGYALINLIAPSAAARLWTAFEGFAEWGLPGTGACAVSWSAPLQGLAAYVEKYRNSLVMHADVADEWKPAIFSCGARIAFPEPTKALKAPKLRRELAGAA
uniref:Mei2-like C-terminal RNA recognition motif domain-containing protein n=1 Tax=Zooxanthella nutricula TaxID=1333877 RepID=A0A7S2Q5Z0_9DINO